MHFLGTNAKPSLNTGTVAVSLLILSGIAVALTVMLPVFVVLSLIIVPAVITTSFLVTGFLASGGFGASGIALLFWLYKLWKEEPWKYNTHAQRVRPEVANKLAIGEKPLEEENPVEVEKRADEEVEPLECDKPSDSGSVRFDFLVPIIIPRPTSEDESLENDKPPEEHMLYEAVKLVDEDKLPPKVILSEGDLPLGVAQASIPDISKVWLVDQKPIGPKRRGSSISTKRSHHIRFDMDHTKVRSIFMKEYQKVPRVGAFAYKFFTSRDKKYINYID